jgi:hypothetical protein
VSGGGAAGPADGGLATLFERVERLVLSVPGGTWPHQVTRGRVLAAMVLALRPRRVVEIGVFGGASLLPMALAMREVGQGRIMGIDPWSAEASVEGQEGENARWWSQLDHEAVYRQFMEAVNREGLSPYVEVVRRRSRDTVPPLEIDIFHCDGNHGPEAIADVNRFGPAVRVGGLAVLDDLDWSGGAVRGAERRLFELGFKFLYPLGTGAVYQRVR